ncbi:MAG: hypothetical protein H0Z32_06330 [Bacillaceae bacterium]|nr:hypothetical protein [Bacillaceae bacterium]
MSKDRKKIILNEIEYWKENRLLPKEYCDFLIALYTEGSGIQSKRHNWKKSAFFLDIMLILLMLPLSFLVIYFTQFSLVMQIFIIFIFLLFLYIHIIYLRKNNSIYFHLALIIFLLVFFILSVHLVNILTGNDFYIQGIVLANCILWAVLGFSKKYHYLTASGIIGVLLLILFFVL